MSGTNPYNPYNPYKILNPTSQSLLNTDPNYINRINKIKRNAEKRNAINYKKTFKKKFKLPNFPKGKFNLSRTKRLKKRKKHNIFSRISSNGGVIKKTANGKTVLIFTTHNPQTFQESQRKFLINKMSKKKKIKHAINNGNYEFKFDLSSVMAKRESLHNRLNPSGQLSVTTKFRLPEKNILQWTQESNL